MTDRKAPATAAIMAEHRECDPPHYDGCYSHWPMAHCRADGMVWPCDVDRIRAEAAAPAAPNDPLTLTEHGRLVDEYHAERPDEADHHVQRLADSLHSKLAAPAAPQPDDALRAAIVVVLDQFDHWTSEPRPAIDGGTVRLYNFMEVQPEMERAITKARAALAARSAKPDEALRAALERLGLSDEQTTILREHLASRQQTVSEFLGDLLMDAGLGRATGKDYPPPASQTAPVCSCQGFPGVGFPHRDFCTEPKEQAYASERAEFRAALAARSTKEQP